MNKYEYELKKIEAVSKAKKTEWIFKIIQTLVVMGGIVWLFSILMNSLEAIAKSNPEALASLAVVFEKLNLAEITSYLVGILGISYGLYERNTRKKESQM
ncbi:hypothetical protein [Acinetobacter sp. BSP-28]|uniref:hypothetical protein n=1 Tax=Acinetobacter sp. BSP-28 TaxID=3344661 RepID=UPI00376F4B55